MSYLVVLTANASLPPGARRRLHAFSQVALSRGWQLKPLSLNHPDPAISTVACLAKAEALVVAGGDGTVNQAINWLLDQGLPTPPLAVLPLGTANDFAAQLWPNGVSATELLDAIAAGQTTPVDLGQANRRYFVNVLAAGMLVEAASETPAGLKHWLGAPAYYLDVLRRLGRREPFALEIHWPNGRIEAEEINILLLLNSPGAGTLRNLAPLASFCDGQLDLFLLRGLRRSTDLLALFDQVRRGQIYTDPRVTYRPLRQAAIRGPENLATVVDGERGPGFPLSISILPRRLRFIHGQP